MSRSTPSSPRLLIASLAVFLAAGGLSLAGLEKDSGLLLGLGVGMVCLSVLGFFLGSWLGRRRTDPLERRREQRLWKSGPLGRKWLEGRRRIP